MKRARATWPSRWGSIGRFDEGRYHATQAIGIARELAAGWRHADAHDVLAIVEIAADRPLSALHAIDEALVVLGETDHPMLRYQLAEHRTWALGMLGTGAVRAAVAHQEPRSSAGGPRDRRRHHRRAGPRGHASRAPSSPAARCARRSSTRRTAHAEKLPRGLRHRLGQPGGGAVRPAARRRGHGARGGRAGGPLGREARLGVPRQARRRWPSWQLALRSVGTAASFATPSA